MLSPVIAATAEIGSDPAFSFGKSASATSHLLE
jgi:hypothetical protein